MERETIKAIFDKQADGYDQQWARTAPIRDNLHFLSRAILSPLPEDAHLLCVGSGTGAEILYLAQQFPGWRFTAVEPSAPMMEVFRSNAQTQGILDRCALHTGYLETLSGDTRFHAATCFLVSQFLLDPQERSAFFAGIAQRLLPSGLFLSTDLAADIGSAEYDSLLTVWLALMTGAEVPPENVENMRRVYGRDVAVLPPERIRELLIAGGFRMPVPFFQAGLIHGWYSRRSDS